MDFLNSDLRVINFTHNDLDGAVSAIVINNVYNVVKTVYIGKSQLGSVVGCINENKDDYDVVIFTDICPTEIMDDLKACGKPFVVIDHHESEVSCHDPDNNIFVVPGKCGAKCTYDMYDPKFHLIRIKSLVDMADDFDMWRLAYPGSTALNILFRHYRFNRFIKTFHNGFYGFTNVELTYIQNYINAATDHIKGLRVFDLPNGGAWTESTKYYAEIMQDFDAKYKWYAIGNRCQDGTHKVSLRCRIPGVNIGAIAKEVGYGGGHEHAAGIIIPKGIEVTPIISRIADMIVEAAV